MTEAPTQARYRAAATMIEGQVSSTEPLSTGMWIAYIQDFEVENFIRIEQVWVKGQLSEDASTLQGQIAGVVPVAALEPLDPHLLCLAAGCPPELRMLAESAAALFGPPDVCDETGLLGLFDRV
ncbi:MAG: hypothetical protein AAF449_00540 [Myxococcota bacterium]